MSVMVAELYEALRKAGVDEPMARAAAQAVLGVESRAELATKGDITDLRAATKADFADMKAAMAEMKSDVLKWNVGAMAILTGIFAAIVRLGN